MMSVLPQHGVLGRLAREPLVHFLVIGAALLLVTSIGNDAGQAPSGTVVITQVDIARIIDEWTRTHGAGPTSTELTVRIEAQVRTEIMSREAVALGLDRDDPIVRQRLAERMTLLASGAAEGAPPTVEQVEALDEWYRRTRAQYTVVIEDVPMAVEPAPQPAEGRGAAAESR